MTDINKLLKLKRAFVNKIDCDEKEQKRNQTMKSKREQIKLIRNYIIEYLKSEDYEYKVNLENTTSFQNFKFGTIDMYEHGLEEFVDVIVEFTHDFRHYKPSVPDIMVIKMKNKTTNLVNFQNE